MAPKNVVIIIWYSLLLDQNRLVTHLSLQMARLCLKGTMLITICRHRVRIINDYADNV